MRALLVRVALAIAVTSKPTEAGPVERFPDVDRPVPVPPPVPVKSPPLPARSSVPSGSQSLVERGTRHEQAGRFPEAIAAYNEAVRLDPSNGRALLALGRLRARMDDFREAEATLSQATGSSDVAAEAFAERARLLKRRGRISDAILDLEKAVAQDRRQSAWAEELAGWYVSRRAWLPALSLYRRLAADLHGTPDEKRAALEVRALRVLCGDLDPVHRGRTRDYSATRRALSKLGAP